MLAPESWVIVTLSSTMSATALTVTLTVAVSVIAARGHRVGEAVGAVEIGGRRVDDEIVGRVARRAVVVDRDGAVRPVGGAGDRRRCPRKCRWPAPGC